MDVITYANQSREEATEYLATAISFAAWFEDHSESALGRYTPNVDRFLAEILPQ